ncbi:hypothetical protein CN03_17335 [Thalassolituus oleivorans]|jgi:hypothetical protein|uniref:type IV toxin-antitoxin system AbiEi family antitoxin n=1 Tax=Thalassolituus oleivorans TaxID=187493 RepID=UPI0009493EB9|nr:type IV toxin-antitoxin system AbiEi family antitoxin [Thalassolituus oleivorans]APR68547.1 hypothetical protein CN03_17335 [Thalassolituus oleivorans]
MPHSDSLNDGIHSLATAVQLPVEIVGLNSPLSNNGLGISIGTAPAIPLFSLVQEADKAEFGELLSQDGAHRVVFMDHISPAKAKKLREAGIQYLDASGNAFIHQHGLHIVVIGKKRATAASNRKQLPAEIKTGKAFQPAGLKVVFALLADHELARASIRTIAERAGVSLGSVSAIIKDLTAHEYLVGSGNQQELINTSQLANRWTELYPYSIRDKAHIGRFTAQTPDWWQALPTDVDYQISGEIAALKLTGYLNPKDGILYAEDAQLPALMKAGRLRQLKTDEKPEFIIDIYRPFWKVDSAMHIAPELIVVSDLLSTSDPRNVDAARRVMNEYLD